MKVKDNMKKVEINLIIIYLTTFLILCIIGYTGNIDILKMISKRASGMDIGYISPLVSLVPPLIYYLLTKLKIKNNQ